MKRNKRIAVTAAVFAFQLLVSVSLCVVQAYRINQAETFSFRLSASRTYVDDGWLYLYPSEFEDYLYGFIDGYYIPLQKDENGVAILGEKTEEKPDSAYLLCSQAMEYSSFYTNSFKIVSVDGESLIRRNVPVEAYLTVRIYKGVIVRVDGVYNENGLMIEIDE